MLQYMRYMRYGPFIFHERYRRYMSYGPCTSPQAQHSLAWDCVHLTAYRQCGPAKQQPLGATQELDKDQSPQGSTSQHQPTTLKTGTTLHRHRKTKAAHVPNAGILHSPASMTQGLLPMGLLPGTTRQRQPRSLHKNFLLIPHRGDGGCGSRGS